MKNEKIAENFGKIVADEKATNVVKGEKISRGSETPKNLTFVEACKDLTKSVGLTSKAFNALVEVITEDVKATYGNTLPSCWNDMLNYSKNFTLTIGTTSKSAEAIEADNKKGGVQKILVSFSGASSMYTTKVTECTPSAILCAIRGAYNLCADISRGKKAALDKATAEFNEKINKAILANDVTTIAALLEARGLSATIVQK